MLKTSGNSLAIQSSSTSSRLCSSDIRAGSACVARSLARILQACTGAKRAAPCSSCRGFVGHHRDQIRNVGRIDAELLISHPRLDVRSCGPV